MSHSTPHSHSGFTLLEVILALLVALAVTAISIPSVTAALSKPPAQAAFERFDSIVQEARSRSRAEGRAYVIVWGRDQWIRLRPEEPASPAEANGVRQWNQRSEGEITLRLPAALLNGKTPEAIWSFWAGGTCEPAEVRYKNGNNKWTALYNPFAATPEVNYD